MRDQVLVPDLPFELMVMPSYVTAWRPGYKGRVWETEVPLSQYPTVAQFLSGFDKGEYRELVGDPLMVCYDLANITEGA
jgi:hypothetical protein